MKIAIGADHAGYAAKEEIKSVINLSGNELKLSGTSAIGDKTDATYKR